MSRTTFSALAVSAMVLLAGCSAEHFYSVGTEALARGQYDRAIDNLAKAAAKEPGNEQYRQALDSARRQASDRAVDEALRLAQASELGRAQTQAQLALRYEPNNADATALLGELRKRVAAAEGKRAEAMRLTGQGQFDQAIDLMQQALNEHRGLPNGGQDMARIRQAASVHWLAQAQAELAAGRYDQAEQHARRALSYSPADYGPQRLLQEVANQRQADELVRRAEEAIRGNRLDAALKDVEQASRLAPNRADIAALLTKVRQGICDRHLAEGRRLLAQGDANGALREFEQSKTLLPGYGQVEELIGQAKIALAGPHRQLGDEAFAAGMWGNSLLHYLMSEALSPGSAPKGAIDDCISRVRARQAYRIGVAVGDPQQRPVFRQAPQILEPTVVEHLAAVRPELVQLANRAQMQRMLANHNVSVGELLGPTGATALRRCRTLDAAVAVRLVDLSFTGDRTRSTGRSRYSAGVQMVDNPDYAQALSARNEAANRVARLEGELTRLERREAHLLSLPPSPARNHELHEVRTDIVRTRRQLADARDDLNRAEHRLAATPRRIAQQTYAEHLYPIQVHTRTARLTIMVELVDAAVGGAVAQETVTAAVTATDHVVEADPVHNVAPDPLQLPDDAELARQVLTGAIPLVQAAAESVVHRFADRHELLAQADIRDRRQELAVEHYVDVLFSDPVAGPRSEQALAAVYNLLGRPPAAAYIRQDLLVRCRVLQPAMRLPIVAEQRDGAIWITRLSGADSGRVQPPCQVVAVAGRPVRTLLGMEAVVNSFGRGDRVGLDVRDRATVTRVFLTVVPAGR